MASRRCAITVQSSKVNDLSTDNVKYVITLDENSVPFSDMETHAKTDFDDLRVYRDNTDTYRCPVHIVHIDHTTNKCRIHVSDVQLSSSSDTTFYLRYGEATWSQPAIDAAYGRNAVYDSSFDAVWTFQEDPSGTAPQLTDVTGSGYNGTSSGTMTSGDLVDGHIGKAWDFDGSNDYVDTGDIDYGNGANITISALINPTVLPSANKEIVSKSDDSSTNTNFIFRTKNAGTIQWAYSESGGWHIWATSSIELTTGSYQHIVLKYTFGTGSSIKVFDNGSSKTGSWGTGTGNSAPHTNNSNINIASLQSYSTNNFDADYDSLSISNVLRSDNWITTEYNNYFSPSTFAVEGTPTTVGATKTYDSGWKIFNDKTYNSGWKVFADKTYNSGWKIFNGKSYNSGWKVFADKTYDSGWKVFNDKSYNSAWKIFTEKTYDSSWKIFDDKTYDSGWKVFNDKTYDSAWKIFADKTYDTAWQILTTGTYSRNTAWKIFNDKTYDSSWRILTDKTYDSSWKIFNEKTYDSSWKILTEKDYNTAWRILNAASYDSGWKIFTEKDYDTGWRILTDKTYDSSWKIIYGKLYNTAWQIISGDAPETTKIFLKDFIKKIYTHYK